MPPPAQNASNMSLASSAGSAKSGGSAQARAPWLPSRKKGSAGSTSEEKAIRREKYGNHIFNIVFIYFSSCFVEQMIAKYQQGPDRNVKLAVWSEKEAEIAAESSSTGSMTTGPNWIQKKLTEMADLLPYEDRQDVLRHFLDKAEGNPIEAVSLYMQAKTNDEI